MKKFLIAALALAALPASAATHQANPGLTLGGIEKGRAAEAAQATRAARADVDAFQRQLAQALARTLTDREVRVLVQQEVGRRFDGDFNVLYRELANRRLADGTSIRERVAAAMAEVDGAPGAADRQASLGRLDRFAGMLPRLQVAVPVNFDRWDAEELAPRVAWLPVSADDAELAEVEAFDAAGNAYALDTRVEPMEPVVVISLNERTDANGFLRTSEAFTAGNAGSGAQSVTGAFIENPETDPGDGGGSGGGSTGGTTTSPCTARTHAYGDKEIFYQIKVNNDHEPWTKGSPEIYATYAFSNNTGVKGRYHMSNVDNEGTWYTLNGHLFYWQSYYGTVMIMAIWEEDGSDWGTFSYSWNGLSYSVNIKDGDDQLGYNPVSFNDPVCGYYSTGDAEYKLRYTAP